MYLSVLLEQLVNGQIVSLLLEGPLREKTRRWEELRPHCRNQACRWSDTLIFYTKYKKWGKWFLDNFLVRDHRPWNHTDLVLDPLCLLRWSSRWSAGMELPGSGSVLKKGWCPPFPLPSSVCGGHQNGINLPLIWHTDLNCLLSF